MKNPDPLQGGSFYKVYLAEEFERRCKKNSRYSLRAFARYLGIDVGNLSNLFSGKKGLSLPAAQKVAGKLKLSPEESNLFLNSVADEQKSKLFKSIHYDEHDIAQRMTPEEVDNEIYSAMADAAHLAILELTFVEGFQSDPAWIAKALGISLAEASSAVERLLKIGLLETREGRLAKTKRHITTKNKGVTNEALKKLMKQFLSQAILSVDDDSVEERSITSMTMAIDPDKLGLARKLIQEFSNSLCMMLESGQRRRVYQLGINLYPLQKKSGG